MNDQAKTAECQWIADQDFLIKMAKNQLAGALRHGTPIISFNDYERKLMRICLEQMREEIIVLLESATTTDPADYFAGV